MPFDYNSFLQGVQTGLRLGRTSPGRKPPVPSGKYILTESGIPIIREQPDWGEVSVFETDTWYELQTPFGYNQDRFTQVRFKTRYRLESGQAILHSQFFYAYTDTYPVYMSQPVCTTNPSVIESPVWASFAVDLLTTEGVVRENWATSRNAPQAGVTDYGVAYYDMVNVWGSTPVENAQNLQRFIPKGADNMLLVNEFSDVWAYIEGLTVLPMITEGG